MTVFSIDATVSYESILFRSDAGIARLTLNRPDRLNSFTDAMHAEVRDALDRVKADATVRVLLLTGAGRGFCAGQDLADRAVAPGAEPVDIGASIERNYKPLVLALRALPLPVVCAVNGVAAGAGANIALACDIVIAAKSASFIQAFAQDRTAPRCGRHVFSAAAGRQRPSDGLGHARRQACRGAGRRLGADLEVRRRRRIGVHRGRAVATPGRCAHARPRRDEAEHCSSLLAIPSTRSSTSNAMRNASLGGATISAKASARSRPSAHRHSRASRRMALDSPAPSPADAQSLAERVAKQMYARDRASQMMGMKVTKVGPGHAELLMTVRDDMLNGHAICHGGFIFTLADSAFAFACNSYNVRHGRLGLRDRLPRAGARARRADRRRPGAQRCRPHRRLRHRRPATSAATRSRCSAARVVPHQGARDRWLIAPRDRGEQHAREEAPRRRARAHRDREPRRASRRCS